MDADLRRALAEELVVEPAGTAAERGRIVQVDLDDLARLVRRAVGERVASADGERSVLEWEAESRLASALETVERAQRLRERLEQHRREVQEELSRVRAALVARRGFAEDLERTSAWPVDPERWHTLRLRAQARLLTVLPAHQPGGPSARVIAADLMELFATERARSLAEFSRHSDVEVARLERRLTQLLTTLEEADEVLAESRALPRVETGFASGYREVQGLEAEVRFREQKALILERIYRANLELQAPPPESHARTG